MPGRDIFLSYSSKDEAIVALTLEKLEGAGHRCWFAPRDIPAAEFYAGQIIQALRESRFVVLFFSAHSNASDQVVREINFAVKQRLPVLVVRLDQTAPSDDFEYLIRISQWLDVTFLASNEEKIARIVGQLDASLAKSGPKTSAAKTPVAMVFGDFEILADSSGKPIELGRGGMGVTYRARQISMGRQVALKVIQPEYLSDDNVRRRFLREAQLAGEIGHENVASVHLRGQEGDSYFYAMELVEGVDLDRYVKANGALNVRDALSVLSQVASALTAANSKGLIHRDIKPSNIMAIRRRNSLRIKLIDFGLAKQVTQQDIHNSLSGKDEFKGTLAYASPEQCQAFSLDTRSDLYSLGVTVWFLLSGKVPFTGTLAAVSGAHIWAPLPLQQLPPLPEAVLQLLKCLMAKKPEDRPQTPGEVEDRAEALLRSLPTDAVNNPSAAQSPSATLPQPDENLTLVGAPVLASYLGPAAGQIREDRFELLESLPEGVTGRIFRARERRGNDTRIVAVKFLHPSICEEQEATESLKTQFTALQKLTLDHLLRYLALEVDSKPPFLVREWVQGIPLTGVLRLKAGTLSHDEVSVLLEPLPALLDALASSGLSLITVRLSKLWIRLPDFEPANLETWVKEAKAQDWNGRLALDPLSLRSLASHPMPSESDVTLLPTSRSLALQQNRAGIKGRTPAQLLATVIYELLSGRPPQSESYRPLAAIPDTANQRLKLALVHEGPEQSTASELWLDLKADFPEAPKAPSSSPQAHSATIRTPDQPLPQIADSKLVAEPNAPAKPKIPGSTPIAPKQPAKPWERHKTAVFLVAMLVPTIFLLGVATIFILGMVRQFQNNQNHNTNTIVQQTVTPSASSSPSISNLENASPLPSSTPAPTESPTPMATPTPSPSNDELARAAFDRGYAAEDKGDHQTAIVEYTDAIRLKPDYPDAFNNRGLAYKNLEQYDKAIADYTEAIRLKPDFASAFNNRGIAYDEFKQYDKAIADYTEAIRLKPDFAFAFSNRGNAYNDLEQYDKAIADYTEAIRLKPDYADALNNRGIAYDEFKQYNKAIVDYSEAIRLKPDFAFAFSNRGKVYNDLKRYDKAIADCSEAIRLKPDFASAFNNRGAAYLGLKQYSKAIADCSEAIRLKPDFAFAFNNRGIAYDDLEQYNKAVADYSEAIRLNPDYPDAFNNRGNAYLGLKQYSKALNDYNEAIRLKPDFALAYSNRAVSYEALGKTAEARRDRAKAEKLNQ